MRVAFFQRFFAHYQWGLMEQLAKYSEHEYVFFGDDHDPMNTGIAPVPSERLSQVAHRTVCTWQPTKHLAFQPSPMWLGLMASFDVFILEGAFQHPTAWCAMLAAQARGKRVLLYTHGWRREDTNAVIRSIRLAFLRQGDALLLYGARAKSIGQSLGIKPERMHVVFNCLDHRRMMSLRNAVDQTACLNVRRQFFGDDEIPMVTYIGRLTSSKRIDLLIEAAGILTSDRHRVGVLIVGDGREIDALRDKASKSNAQVHFAGAVYQEEALSLLISASNVMVVPGPLGLSGIHAMTYGTPVITDDAWTLQMPEVEAVIPGKTGAFFRTGDAQSLADVLLPFLINSNMRSTYYRNCVKMIDCLYNPVHMRKVFDAAVSGKPTKLILPQTMFDS